MMRLWGLHGLWALALTGCLERDPPRFSEGGADATVEFDAGVGRRDADVAERTPDAAMEPDASPSLDAELGVDAGVEPDAQMIPDAERPADVGPPLDAELAPGPLFARGDGTPGSPYEIETPEQLDNMRCRPDAHFLLAADISFGEQGGWVPIGAELAARGGCPDTPFRGRLDGGGHRICGLTLIPPLGGAPLGLFSRVEHGRIHALSLIGVTIESVGQPAGGLVGEAVAEGDTKIQIFDVAVSGTINGEGAAGGIVGIGEAVGLERVSFHGEVVADGPIGGIAGQLNNATLAEVEVESALIDIASFDVRDELTSAAGGLVGVLTGGGSIRDFTVSVAHLRGRRLLGGAVGTLNITGTVWGGYTEGVIQTAGGNTGAAAGLVGHYVGGGGLSHVFTTMNTTQLSPRASTGKIIGEYIAAPAFEEVYLLADVGDGRCVGSDFVTPNGCMVVGEGNDTHFYSVGNPPMSSWQVDRWAFTPNSLPRLARVPEIPEACR